VDFEKIKIENDNYLRDINLAKEYINLFDQNINKKLSYIHPNDDEIEDDSEKKKILIKKDFINNYEDAIYKFRISRIDEDFQKQMYEFYNKQDNIKKEKDTDPQYIQYSNLLTKHNKKRSPVQFFLRNTNIIPIEMSFQQRPTCFLWSMLRALHPEKTQDESMCMLNEAVLKSGIHDVQTIHEYDYFDLVLIHIFETFINTNKLINKSETEIDEYRSHL
jgi:hypothetical protein